MISWCILFFTVLSISAVFAMSNSTEPLNSLYLLTRKIELGNFLQRLDALFILLWLVSMFCYLSLSIFMINRILQKITNVENSKMLSFSVTSIFFGLCLIPLNIEISRFMENTIYRYLIIILSFIISFLILLFANLKQKIKKGRAQIND